MAKIRVSDKTIESVLRGAYDEEDELGKMLGFHDSEESSIVHIEKTAKTVQHSTKIAELKSQTPVQSYANKVSKKEIVISESPELSYTPGKSRLDANSMARLKVFIQSFCRAFILLVYSVLQHI